MMTMRCRSSGSLCNYTIPCVQISSSWRRKVININIACQWRRGLRPRQHNVAKNGVFSFHIIYIYIVLWLFIYFLLLMFPSSMSVDRFLFFLYTYNIIIYSPERVLLRQMMSRVQSVIILPFERKRHCSSKTRARHKPFVVVIVRRGNIVYIRTILYCTQFPLRKINERFCPHTV
jgi:hypothetical protein